MGVTTRNVRMSLCDRLHSEDITDRIDVHGAYSGYKSYILWHTVIIMYDNNSVTFMLSQQKLVYFNILPNALHFYLLQL